MSPRGDSETCYAVCNFILLTKCTCMYTVRVRRRFSSLYSHCRPTGDLSVSDRCWFARNSSTEHMSNSQVSDGICAVQAYVLDGSTSWHAVPPPNSMASNGDVISVEPAPMTSSLLQQLETAWWRNTPLLHVSIALTVLPVDAARDPPTQAAPSLPLAPAAAAAPRQYRPAAAAADDVYVTDGVDGG